MDRSRISKRSVSFGNWFGWGKQEGSPQRAKSWHCGLLDRRCNEPTSRQLTSDEWATGLAPHSASSSSCIASRFNSPSTTLNELRQRLFQVGLPRQVRLGAIEESKRVMCSYPYSTNRGRSICLHYQQHRPPSRVFGQGQPHTPGKVRTEASFGHSSDPERN